MGDTCKTCRYWLNLERHDRDETGLCRRHPPTVIPALFAGRELWAVDELIEGATEFPIIQAWQWCGEHRQNAESR